MSLLAIDQGNTRTKFGLFRHGTLVHTWSVDTDRAASPAALAQAASMADLPADACVGLCTVVPALGPVWRQAMTERKFHEITGASSTPLRNAYATPDTLGPDRLLAAVAAAEIAVPVVVVSLGTATVVDAVSAERVYLGGMIAPGLRTLSRQLADAASALHPVAWREPDRALGRTTEDALTSGWYHLALGGLQAMIQAARNELGIEAPLVLTGGWAETLAPYLAPLAVDAHLVLRGLARVIDSTE